MAKLLSASDVEKLLGPDDGVVIEWPDATRSTVHERLRTLVNQVTELC